MKKNTLEVRINLDIFPFKCECTVEIIQREIKESFTIKEVIVCDFLSYQILYFPFMMLIKF